MAKKIGVLCEQFFDMQGNGTCLFGGGERWLFDFVSLIKEMGYEAQVFQFSTKPWTMRHKNMSVKGLGNISTPNANPYIDYPNGIKLFNEATAGWDGSFFLSMNLCMETPKRPTLSVSHGLMFDWDTPNQYSKPIDNLDAFKKWIRNTTETISVDTNTIKVMQVYHPQNVSKMTYVPNYVDLNKFEPSEVEEGSFKVLFARRLQSCRGYHLMMDATDRLLDKYQDIEVTFCGKGNKAETNHFESWLSVKDSRVKYTWKEMSEMPSVYKNQHCSIVPTTMAEGTSLSCIESMASGVVPVVTTVGGLTDLVLKDVNGLMIKPNSVEEIVSAVEYLYNNREHLADMRDMSIKTSKKFGKDIWEQRIANIVRRVFGEP